MKTIKLALVALLLIISSQLINAQSLIGTWEHTAIENEADTLVTTLTFNEDGTFTRFQEQSMSNFRNQSATVLYQAEGKWKLMSGGKRLYMKVKPSSVKVNSEGETHGTIAKLAEVSGKFDAVSSLYIPKILSLTEDELILLESIEDESGLDDVPSSYTVQVIYKRK